MTHPGNGARGSRRVPYIHRRKSVPILVVEFEAPAESPTPLFDFSFPFEMMCPTMHVLVENSDKGAEDSAGASNSKTVWSLD